VWKRGSKTFGAVPFDGAQGRLRYGLCPILRHSQDGAQDDRPRGAEGSPVERALADLGIEWKDVMALGVHSDRVVVIEGPVGYKRVYAFPGAGDVEE
jgi:hypothetical protein